MEQNERAGTKNTLFGRKKKAAQRVKKVRSSVRYSDEEWAKVLENCKDAERQYSDYIRELALKPKIIFKQTHRQHYQKILAQIMKIGINLNQIARGVNNQYELISSQDIQKQLEIITRQLSSIYDDIQGLR